MRIYREVNVFIRRINRQEVLTFLVFLLLSAFFWTIETAQEENDATYMVDFYIENQPVNTVFTTQIPTQLKVQIKDKNINLLNYNFNKIDTLTVDFTSYNDALGNFRISSAELQALLINKLFPSTQITSLTPSSVDAKFAITEGKTVPVVLSADASAAENYRCLTPVIFPDSVTVHAPSFILDTISVVRTEFYEAYNLKDTVNLRLPLQLSIGVRSTPNSVNVIIPVARFVEKTITGISVNVVDAPATKNLSIFPNKVDLTCLVDFSQFNSISEEDFFLSVSYNSLDSANQKYLPIDVISYANPGMVSNIKLLTNKVEFLIEEN